MPVIETENLRKVYRDVVAVNGLTLSVEQGEVFGFLGPNGAGQDDYCQDAARLVHPTAAAPDCWVTGQASHGPWPRSGFCPNISTITHG